MYNTYLALSHQQQAAIRKSKEALTWDLSPVTRSHLALHPWKRKVAAATLPAPCRRLAFSGPSRLQEAVVGELASLLGGRSGSLSISCRQIQAELRPCMSPLFEFWAAASQTEKSSTNNY
jgi:hypothetical protein